ncbi:MAG: TlpA family protein disulfide reductase [Clostridiales bacterium]|nr:TlpA family protein disulfide reductase [Clostridiales bacterium]
MKMAKVFAMMLAILMIGTCAFAQPLNTPQVGDAAIDFEIKMIDGENFRLSDYRGKVVFLNIWATWCGPCVMEMPAIEQLANAYPEDLVVIGVSCDDREETVKAFVEQQGYTYNFAWDSNYMVSGLLFPSYAIPNSIFINPDGVITSMEMGAASYEVMEQRYLDSLASAADAAA